MAIVIPRNQEYWIKDLSNRVYEIDRNSPFAAGLAAAVVSGVEISQGLDFTANTTTQDGPDLVATDNTVNAYIQKPLIVTDNGLGTGDFSLYMHGKIAAADGTVSNLIGNKNDLAGNPFSQGFIGAHMNSGGGYAANSLALFTFSGGTTATQLAGSIDTTQYQDILGSRDGSTLSLHVGDSSAASSGTIRNVTGSDPRFIFGNSGKSTNGDAGAFVTPIGLAWNRAVSEEEYNDLRLNPAQILTPRRSYWSFPDEAGGISITGQTSNTDWQAIQGIVDLTPTLSITGQTANSNWSAIPGDVSLSAGISITGQTANANWQAIPATVELTPTLEITGQTSNTSWSAIAGEVSLTAGISITGQTSNADWKAQPATVTLSGTIDITGQTSNANWVAVKGSVSIGSEIGLGISVLGLIDDAPINADGSIDPSGVNTKGAIILDINVVGLIDDSSENTPTSI